MKVRIVYYFAVICILSGLASGSVALKQDFNEFTAGSLGTAGQGDAAAVGGHWESTHETTDPSIVDQSVRLTEGEGRLLGYSNVSPVAQGDVFMVSFSIFFIDMGDDEQIGSFYVYVDNAANLSTSTIGIAMYTDTVGHLSVYDAESDAYRYVQNMSKFSLYDSKDSWVDFKIVVTTWDDGSGYGRYDTYINQGDGWLQVDADNAFSSGDLHDGVNGILFRPRTPAIGMPLIHVDDVSIATEPVDCMDVGLLGYELNSDIKFDCYVNSADLMDSLTGYLADYDPSDKIETAGTVLQSGFENFALGSIGGGVGDAIGLEGRWRPIGASAPDPSIVNTQAHTGSQSMQLSRGSGVGANFVGWTTGDAVPDGSLFDLTAWVNVYSDEGSWTMAVNNYDYIQTNQPIAVYITNAQDIRAWEYRDDGGEGWHYSGAMAAVGSWIGIKIVVTDLGDGSSTVAGRGFYDVYTDTGSGWTKVMQDIGFNSSKLYDGVNSVFFSPQGATGISGYIDDVAIGWDSGAAAPDILDVGLVVIDQDFDTLPLGPIATGEGALNGVGDTDNTGGRWRQSGSPILPDPSVVDTFAHSGAQSYRISRNPDGNNSLGWTYAGAAPEGIPFEFSCWINKVAEGSFVVWLNNYDNVQSDYPISLFIQGTGALRVWEYFDGGNKSWGVTDYYLSDEVWTGIRVVVTSWGDGSGTVAGRGFYDVYVNINGPDDWRLVRSGIGFDSSKLHDGVNSIFFSPQSPSGYSAYIDDIKLMVDPSDCSEVFAIGAGMPGDFDSNCKVDLNDFAEFATEWLFCNDPEDTSCLTNW